MILDHSTLLKTLPLQIASQLAAAIAQGEYTPGDRFRETELAERYSVSRATIREALRLLETRGLVSIQPQRGARVTPLSTKELYDLFALRASLLSTCSRLAAQLCDENQAAQLRARLVSLRDSVHDADRYTEHSAALVDYITRMADNPILATYVNDLVLRIGRYVRMGLMAEERRKRSVALWAQLIDDIIDGDSESAAARHYRLAVQNRDAALQAFDPGPQ
ncbi:MAG: GntR family transcriptional regulator [Pusillimonas sp.]